MIANLSPALRRWTERTRTAAILGIAAAVGIYGYASAIAPTTETGRTFAGSVNIAEDVSNFAGLPAYTVPAGHQYTITDVIIANGNTSIHTARISISALSTCGNPSVRINDVIVASFTTLHLPLITGTSFGPGKTVCLYATGPTSWTVRGYLSSDT